MMRDWCTNKKSKLITEDPNTYSWILDTPAPIRDAAVLELLQAFESNQAKQKKQEERGEKVMDFTVKYKNKKRDSQTIYISSQRFINGVFYSEFFGRNKFKCREKDKEKKSALPNKLDYSAKLTRNNVGQYYLCISEASKSKHIENKRKIAIIDPGKYYIMIYYIIIIKLSSTTNTIYLTYYIVNNLIVYETILYVIILL